MFAKVLIAIPLIAAPLLAATPAFAQKTDAGGPPQRVRSVVLFGEDKCPPATDPNEIVVCASGGESPYRIPKEFRELPDESAKAQSWRSRVDTVIDVNREVLPGACNSVGTFGQTGCSQQAVRQWLRDKADQKAKEGRVP